MNHTNTKNHVPKFLIYGAYGFIGKLCLRLAVKRGLKDQVIIAGRRLQPLKQLVEEYELSGDQYKAFSLSDTVTMHRVLGHVKVVLNCAGPFQDTSLKIVEECLKMSVHYMDIASEYDVISAIATLDKKAKEEQVYLIPGVGFSVTATDCLARQLHTKLPDATQLELGVSPHSSTSPGTMKSFVRHLTTGKVRARVNHEVEKVPFSHKSPRPITLRVGKKDKTLNAQAVTLGDIQSAYYTTGIPNITTFCTTPTWVSRILPYLAFFMYWLSFLPFFTYILDLLIRFLIRPPREYDLQSGSAQIWGEVKDNKGNVLTGAFQTPDVYLLTADASIRAVEKVLRGKLAVKQSGGYLSPSIAFGMQFIQECDGVSETVFDKLDTRN